MIFETIGPVVLVGAGKMGLALARGWVAGGLPAEALKLVDLNPGPATIAFAQQNKIWLGAELPDAVPAVLVLAVKPQVFGPVMGALADKIGPNTLVLSIAAGISLATISAAMGTQRVVRTMPNTPAQVGKGVTGAVAGSAVEAKDRDVTDALLSAAGQVVWLAEEGDIDPLTAISGSGPAYVFHFVEALAAAGVAEGLDEAMAMQLARQTVIGAAALLDGDPAPAGVLRQNVASPGGTTAAALAVLMAEDGLSALMARAVKAARTRSEELGK